jgi:hypothetical protein
MDIIIARSCGGELDKEELGELRAEEKDRFRFNSMAVCVRMNYERQYAQLRLR